MTKKEKEIVNQIRRCARKAHLKSPTFFTNALILMLGDLTDNELKAVKNRAKNFLSK